MKCDHERPVFGCLGCVERANVGMTREDGAKTFRVEVERTASTVFFLVAATKEQADEEAEELAETLSHADFENVDESCIVTEWFLPVEPGDAVWEGGPKGGWVKEVTA